MCTRGVSASWMLRAWRTRIGTKVIRMAFLFSVPQTTVLLRLLLLLCSLPTVATAAAAALSTSVYLVVFQLVKLQACPQFWCIVEQSQLKHDTKVAAALQPPNRCHCCHRLVHLCVFSHFSASKASSMSTILMYCGPESTWYKICCYLSTKVVFQLVNPLACPQLYLPT